MNVPLNHHPSVLVASRRTLHSEVGTSLRDFGYTYQRHLLGLSSRQHLADMQLRRAATLASIPPHVLLYFKATPPYAASFLVAECRPAGAPPLGWTAAGIL